MKTELLLERPEDAGKYEKEEIYALTRVRCGVRACAHHDGDSFCTLPEINVSSVSAYGGKDVRCADFIPRAW